VSEPVQSAVARTKALGGDRSPERVREILKALDEAYPKAECALNHRSPWELLVATILSAQCTDVRVNMVTPELFERFPTPAAMAKATIPELIELIRTTGFFNNKAKSLKGAAETITAKFGGKVPETLDELVTVPGAARKTANVVLNVAFGDSTMAVDTHIFRLGNRTGIAPGTTPRAVEDALVRRIPPELLRDAHHWLILHGRYVCKARLPECWRCVAAQWCRYPNKTPPPVEKPKASRRLSEQRI